jgi:hypothetical protein
MRTDTLPTVTGPVRTGWEPGCPQNDTVTLQAVRNLAARVLHQARAMGGQTHRDERWALGDQKLATPFANVAVALKPIASAGDVAALQRFFTGPFLVMSAWPTPDLSATIGLVGHPPFMLRPAGGDRPSLPPGLVLTEVHDRATARRFERVLVDGYPIPEVAERPAGTLLDERAFGHELRGWIGTVDGTDVSVATAFTACGVNQVEMVATLAEARGHGFGAGVTLAATMADPALPAVLIASDDGRPVYERMGFIPLTRWTLWVGAAGIP